MIVRIIHSVQILKIKLNAFGNLDLDWLNAIRIKML